MGSLTRLTTSQPFGHGPSHPGDYEFPDDVFDLEVAGGHESEPSPGPDLSDYEFPDDVFDLEVAGGHEPEPSPGPDLTTSQLKRPLVWIAGRNGSEPPLQVGTSHVLHIQMGVPGSTTLVRDGAGDIPVEDIPEEGLLTDWVVSSQEVALETHSDDSGVKVSVATYNEGNMPDGAGSNKLDPKDKAFKVWSARFELLIPREGESDVRKIGIRPVNPGRGRLEFLIYLRNDAHPTGLNELYRWFHVDLPLSAN
jgi:hypothetical protein